MISGWPREPSDRVDPGKKAVTPRQLLLCGVLQVGKPRLHRPGACRGKDQGIISRLLVRRGGRGINQRFPKSFALVRVSEGGVQVLKVGFEARLHHSLCLQCQVLRRQIMRLF